MLKNARRAFREHYSFQIQHGVMGSLNIFLHSKSGMGIVPTEYTVYRSFIYRMEIGCLLLLLLLRTVADVGVDASKQQRGKKTL